MTNNNNQFARVALGFSRLVAARLIEFIRNVITLMTSNPNFTTPSPTLAAVDTAVTQYESLVQEASNGDRIVIAARNAAKGGLLSLVRQLAAYVQGQANGNRAVLLSSGFKATRLPATPSLPGVPVGPVLLAGPHNGSLFFRFRLDRNTRNCSIQLADAADGPWTDWGLSTRSKVLLEGLTPLRSKWARARANGAAGSSEWTEPTCKIVI